MPATNRRAAHPSNLRTELLPARHQGSCSRAVLSAREVEFLEKVEFGVYGPFLDDAAAGEVLVGDAEDADASAGRWPVATGADVGADQGPAPRDLDLVFCGGVPVDLVEVHSRVGQHGEDIVLIHDWEAVVAQTTQNSLPSGSSITTWSAWPWTTSRRSTVAPALTSSATFASIRLVRSSASMCRPPDTFRSRWSRFLARWGSDSCNRDATVSNLHSVGLSPYGVASVRWLLGGFASSSSRPDVPCLRSAVDVWLKGTCLE